MSLFDRKYWARTALATVMVSAGVIGAMRIAGAVPGGETRPSLSFAGTLTGTTGGQMLTFAFKRGTMTVCSPRVNVTPGPTGAFNVEVPLMGCPTGLFDGGDVTFDVTVGSTVLARDQAVNPVPYARYADRVGTPDCPTGYDRDSSATGIILCRRGQDEVVRVGTGASAFWIDRYEASVWQNPDGTGTQYGAGGDNYPSTFPDNGQARPSNFVFAVSKAGVTPSGNLTWFQSGVACRASGKRLMTRDEWFIAASGTEDPGASTGAGGACVTSGGSTRETGRGVGCASIWGAQDMIGNVFEYTDEWYAGLNSTTSEPFNPWPSVGSALYGADLTWNVDSRAYPGGGLPYSPGLPAAALRGGDANNGNGSGIFALYLSGAPSAFDSTRGFRCVIPR